MYLGCRGGSPYPREAETYFVNNHTRFKGLLSLWLLKSSRMVRIWPQLCGDVRPNWSMRFIPFPMWSGTSGVLHVEIHGLERLQVRLGSSFCKSFIFAYLYVHNFTRNSPTVFKVLLCTSLSVQVRSLTGLSKGETFSHGVTTLVYIQIFYQVVCSIIKIEPFHNDGSCCLKALPVAQAICKMNERI